MRTPLCRICQKCGAEFTGKPRKAGYLCPDCAKQNKHDSAFRAIKCAECGKVFYGLPNSQYCAECAEERRKEQNREHKRTGAARPIGSIDICQNCGEKYVVSSGLQKFCKKCAAECIKQKERARKMQQYCKNRDKINAKRREKRNVKFVCRYCGKTFEPKDCEGYCSDECRKLAAARRAREYRKKQKK